MSDILGFGKFAITKAKLYPHVTHDDTKTKRPLISILGHVRDPDLEEQAAYEAREREHRHKLMDEMRRSNERERDRKKKEQKEEKRLKRESRDPEKARILQ